MSRNQSYNVKYKLFSADKAKNLNVAAKSKVDAYDKAVFDMIPKLEGELPYSAWVSSVTYQNGNSKEFNTFEGLPY